MSKEIKLEAMEDEIDPHESKIKVSTEELQASRVMAIQLADQLRTARSKKKQLIIIRELQKLVDKIDRPLAVWFIKADGNGEPRHVIPKRLQGLSEEQLRLRVGTLSPLREGNL